MNKSERQILAEQIDAQAARKLRAKGSSDQGVWFGLGFMGLVGWSVAVPTLLGAAVGLWLDKNHPGGHSWTLALLVAGLTLGCFNAWRWVSKEDRAMHTEPGTEAEPGLTMNETFVIGLTLVAGAVLGLIFFGGLWWTVGKALASKVPALWFLGSLILRMGVTLSGFYAISSGGLMRLASSLIGLLVGRQIVLWVTRHSIEPPSFAVKEAIRAP